MIWDQNTSAFHTVYNGKCPDIITSTGTVQFFGEKFDKIK